MAFCKCVWVEMEGGEEQVATIPSCWVDEEEMTVRWPVKINALRALQERRKPEAHWKTFELIKIKLQDDDIDLCEDYDLTETEDERGCHFAKEQTESPRRSENKSTALDNGKQQSTPSPKSASKVPSKSLSFKKPRITPVALSGQHTGSSNHAEKSQSPIGLKRMSSPASEASQAKTSRLDDDDKRDRFPMTDKKFQYKTLSLLTEMRDMLRQLLNSKEVDEGEELVVCSSKEDLDTLNTLLGDASRQKQIMKKISRIGGATFRDNTRNVMRKLMTNGCMSNFNMNGQRGKEKFKLFGNVLKLIENAVLTNFDCTTSDVEKCMAVVFKQAPDRCGGSGRKHEEAEEVGEARNEVEEEIGGGGE